MTRVTVLLPVILSVWLNSVMAWAQPGDRRIRSVTADFVVEADKPFAEGFSAAKLNRSRWNVEVTGRTVNNEQQAYVDSEETLYVVHDGPLAEGAEDVGVLVIHPRWRKGYSSESTRGRQYDFISGRINTRGKVEFTHGTAAARIRMTSGAGLWPAFWLLGNGRWPATGEIDILEYVGDESWVSQAVHGPGYSGNTPIVNRFSFPEGTTATDWHVYSVDWSNSEMVFRIDDEVVYRVTKAMVQEHGRWVFDKPKFVVVNFALGGGYPQGVNRVRQPYPGLPESTVDLVKKGQALYLVDWLRVTKK